MTTSRPYTDDDLARLQATLAEWIRDGGDRGYCHVGDVAHAIYSGLRGRFLRGEAVRLWEESGEVVAFGLANPAFELLYANVSPRCRGADVEREVLEWGYETTRRLMDESGAPDKPVLTEWFEGDTIRRDILEDLGWAYREHWGNLTERQLADPIPEPALPDGFTMRPARLDDGAALGAVHSGAFGSTWPPGVYLDEVMRKPGYRVEREFVVVAPDGRFAAFTVTWLDEVNKVGLFEPVGTHADFHRRGIGKALLHHVLRDMRDRGMERAHVGHEADNPGSAALYNSVGFRTKYGLHDYARP